MSIRLQIPTDPSWIDLPHGVRVRCRALTTATNAAALEHARREIIALREDFDRRRAVGVPTGDLPDLSDDDLRSGYAHALYAGALAHACIIEWSGRGIEDPETDQPAPVTPENTAALMMIPDIARAFIDSIWSAIGEVTAEGNVCAPLPPGSSAQGASTADPAAFPEAPALTGA